MRINELAKELNISSKDLLDYLAAQGVAGKSHSSSLDEEWSGNVRSHFAPVPEPEPEPEAEAVASPATPAVAEGMRPVRKMIKKMIRKVVRRVPAGEAGTARPAAGDGAAPGAGAAAAAAGAAAATAAAAPPSDRDETAIARAIRAQLLRKHQGILKPRPAPPPPPKPVEPERPELPRVVAPVVPQEPPAVREGAPGRPAREPSPEMLVPDLAQSTLEPAPPAPPREGEEKKGHRKEKKEPDRAARDKRGGEVKPRRKGKLQPPRETLAEALHNVEDLVDVDAAPIVDPALAKRAAQIVAAPRTVGRKKAYKREKRQRVQQAQQATEAAQEEAKTTLRIHEATTVAEIAGGLAITPGELITKLFGLGVMATANQQLDRDTIEIIADEYNFKIEETSLYEVSDVFREDEDRPEDLAPRPPVVTIMGHVDHGKTKLLDALRKTNVVAGEVGGITQKISAFRTRMHERDIVFLDTPGHEAFTAMRARGAQVTDIVVLVVAANDGVMPQTIEALNHAKAAGVPMVVAVNKVDLPDANVDRVKQQLSELGLSPEEWGGQTQFVSVSALKRTGLDDLLEAILLQADLLELKANARPMGRGTVVEARLDQGRGAVATVLVQKGTLAVGDPFVAGVSYGRVRAMFNDSGQEVKQAGPSTPVEVLGFSGVPESGDRFIAVPSEKEARDFAVRLSHLQRERALKPTAHVSLESLSEQVSAGETKELNVIIKGDVQGSVEALKDALLKQSTDKVKVVVRHSGVGAMNVSDVYLADTTDSLMLGFSVRVNVDAQALAHSLGVNIRIYDIIFNAIEDVRGAMGGLLEKKVQESVLGHCEVREVFRAQRSGSIAGCYVTDGKLVRNARIRVKRDATIKYEGPLTTLRRFKDDAREVASGFECGVGLDGLVPFEPGDVIECYELLEVAQTL